MVTLLLIAASSEAQGTLYVGNLGNGWTGGGIGDIHNIFPGGTPYGTDTARFTTGAGTFSLNAVTFEFYSGFYAPQWVNVQIFRNSNGTDLLLGSLGNPVVNPTPTQWPQSSNPSSFTAFVDFRPLTPVILDPLSQYSVVASMFNNSPTSAGLLFTKSSAYVTPTDWIMGETSSDNPFASGERLVMGVSAASIPELNITHLMFFGFVVVIGFRILKDWTNKTRSYVKDSAREHIRRPAAHSGPAIQLKILLGASLCAVALAFAHAAEPVLGKSPRYCNPLPMVSGAASASGDVTVIRENGKYYMYCTGGGAWVSDDMLNWTLHRIANVPVAPHVVKFNGAFYMCGNDGPLFKADNPLGPFASIGNWTNTPGVAGGWNGAFDMDIFVDDDNRPYLYFPGRGVSGIYVVPLDPDNLTRFTGPPKHLFAFNSSHVWERYGEMNEYPEVAWVEGPWLQKYNGTYYLEYSASGTQWKTYAEGYYTAKSPMGPFTYAPNNPLLRRTEGLVTGTAHGSIVEGPEKQLWQFYTIVLNNPPGGRRIGMDPIAFDKNGNISCRITDTPQWAPGVVADAAKDGDSGSIPVSINKVRAMNAETRFSSQQPGHDAAYAVDNSSGTWWEPGADDATPTLTLDLGPATRFDVTQLFTVDSVRLLFTGGRGFGGRGGRGGRRGAPGVEPAAVTNAPAMASATGLPSTEAFQYKIEVSTDGSAYTSVLDQSTNAIVRNTIFEEIRPTKCRLVRLTMLNWPRTTPLGIIEFTVFGKPTGSLPAQVAIPEVR